MPLTDLSFEHAHDQGALRANRCMRVDASCMRVDANAPSHCEVRRSGCGCCPFRGQQDLGPRRRNGGAQGRLFRRARSRFEAAFVETLLHDG